MRFFVVALSLVLFSCSGEDPATNETEKKDSLTVQEIPQPDEELLSGTYSGPFGKSTLLLSLNYVKGKNASGFNVVRGNRRNIKGKVEWVNDRFHFVMKEPGGHPHDGEFDFEIDPDSRTIEGRWTPFDEKVTTPKDFQLQAMDAGQGTDKDLKGFWYGMVKNYEGNIELKKDGTFLMKGYVFNYDEENFQVVGDVSIRGNWFEEENGVRLEFEKNHPLKVPSTISLELLEEEGVNRLTNGEDDVSLNRWY